MYVMQQERKIKSEIEGDEVKIRTAKRRNVYVDEYRLVVGDLRADEATLPSAQPIAERDDMFSGGKRDNRWHSLDTGRYGAEKGGHGSSGQRVFGTVFYCNSIQRSKSVLQRREEVISYE